MTEVAAPQCPRDLRSAWSELQTKFKQVRTDSNLSDYVAICSGGWTKPKELIPCLCISEEIAVDLWRKTFDEFLSTVFPTFPRVLIWRSPPIMRRFTITMQGADQQHRLVSPRFAVYSEAAFSDRVSNVPAGSSSVR